MKKIMPHIKWFLLTLLLCGLVYYFKPTKTQYITDFPFIINDHLKGQTNLGCESLVFTEMSSSKDSSFEKDGVKGEVLKGTDKLAIKIEDKTIKFLTRASLEAGTAEGRPFNIIKNDEKELIAFDIDDEGTLNTFLLQKKSGLGIWTKGRLKPFLRDYPDTQSFYLICR